MSDNTPEAPPGVAPSDAALLAGIGTVARAHLGYTGPLNPEMSLVETLRLDSVRLLTLVAELENHFKIILEPDDEAGLETVADLVALLRKRVG